jgi:hypothetical protein
MVKWVGHVLSNYGRDRKDIKEDGLGEVCM